jgi:hypothetical protein
MLICHSLIGFFASFLAFKDGVIGRIMFGLSDSFERFERVHCIHLCKRTFPSPQNKVCVTSNNRIGALVLAVLAF